MELNVTAYNAKTKCQVHYGVCLCNINEYKAAKKSWDIFLWIDSECWKCVFLVKWSLLYCMARKVLADVHHCVKSQWCFIPFSEEKNYWDLNIPTAKFFFFKFWVQPKLLFTLTDWCGPFNCIITFTPLYFGWESDAFLWISAFLKISVASCIIQISFTETCHVVEFKLKMH